MSYHGYAKICKEFLGTVVQPTVLEVGVDRGVMLFIMAHHLVRTKDSFVFMGCDVAVQEQVKIVVGEMDCTSTQRVVLVQENSLTLFPKLVNNGAMFDLVLIDGDHNYYTVSKELTYLDALLTEHGMVIVDDYSGRWSDKDLWYAQRPGYEKNARVTSPVETNMHGVKPAVDEFLSQHLDWIASQRMTGEPIVLQRRPATR